MGLLDDLEQEAQRRKQGLDDVARQKAEREEAYKTRLEPGMNALHEYLTKLTTNLGFLKPKKVMNYELPGFGRIVAYIDHEYDMKISAQATSREITLQFGAVVSSEESSSQEVAGASKIKQANAMFQKLRLSGMNDPKKDENGEIVHATFRPRGKIPLLISISADADTAVVKMNFTNFEEWNTVNKTVGPLQFNEATFDEIGRFIAREPNSLFREALPDDVKRQLQAKLQQEQMRRKWEAKIADQQKEELEKLQRESAAKEGGLLSKMKSLFKRT